MSPQFTIPISHILLSTSLPRATALRHIAILFPALEGFPESHIHTISPDDDFAFGSAPDFDRTFRHKPLVVFAHTDKVSPIWVHDAVLEYLRPVLVMETDAAADTSRTILLHRRFIRTGKKGHDHADYHPTDASQNSRFQFLQLAPGQAEPHLTPEEVKAQYDTY